MAVEDLVPLVEILGVTIVAAFITEYASWFLGARKPEVVELDQNLQKKKAQYLAEVDAQKRKAKKNTGALEMRYNQIREETQKLSMTLLKSQVSSAALMMMAFPLVLRAYKGVAIGTLPFAPVWYFKTFIQQGLEDAGPYDMSATFWYFLCIGASRGIVKLLFPQVTPPSIMDLPDPSSVM